MECEVRLSSGRRLSSLKVKDLQKELNKRRLSSLGRKAELVARLTEFFTKSAGHKGDFNGDNEANAEISAPPELPRDSERTAEMRHEKGKKSRRRSHLRLNETFDYIEDDEDSTQRNNTLTPQGNSTSPLVDAYHRKSSRQSKDRHSGGDGADSPCSETIRAQTPRSSRKARRSSTIRCTDFLTDDEPEANPMDSDICTECLEKENISNSNHKAETGHHFARSDQHRSDKSKILSASKSRDQTTKSNSAMPKQSEIPVPTPASASKRRGGFTASTLSSAVRNAARKSKIPSRAKSTTTKLEGLPSSSRSIKKSKGNGKSKEIALRVSPAENFARQHARIFEKMETIGDNHERIARRHEQIMQAVPNTLKRLATPKSVHRQSERAPDVLTKKSGYIFDASKAKVSVTESSFKFGKVEDFPTEQKRGSSGKVTNSFVLKPVNKKIRDHRDVKSRTKDDSKQRTVKKLISATVPTENVSINILATPKGMTPSRPRGKVSYTPHRGVVTYVDTSKLSDRDFELAVANGLIKARSGRYIVTSPRSSMRLEASRKASRDDILDVKRKLKIVQ